MISESVLFSKQIFYTGFRMWMLQKPFVFTECRFTLSASTVCKLKRVKHLRVYINNDSLGISDQHSINFFLLQWTKAMQFTD